MTEQQLRDSKDFDWWAHVVDVLSPNDLIVITEGHNWILDPDVDYEVKPGLALRVLLVSTSGGVPDESKEFMGLPLACKDCGKKGVGAIPREDMAHLAVFQD